MNATATGALWAALFCVTVICAHLYCRKRAEVRAWRQWRAGLLTSQEVRL